MVKGFKYDHDFVDGSVYLYTVINNRTGQVIALKQTAQDCAEKLGICKQRFYEMVCRVESGKLAKWTIFKSYADGRNEVNNINYKCRKGIPIPRKRINKLRDMSVHDLAKYLADCVGSYEDFPCSLICGTNCPAKSVAECIAVIEEYLQEEVV